MHLFWPKITCVYPVETPEYIEIVSTQENTCFYIDNNT